MFPSAPEELAAQEVRRHVMACMETGNHANARTALVEYAALDAARAEALRVDVVASYGTLL